MITFLSDRMDGHDPGTIGKPPGAGNEYFSDVAERGRVLRGALEEAAFGPMLEPAPLDRDVLAAVHTEGLIGLVSSAFRRIAEEEGHREVLLPETFAMGVRRGASRSVWADLGYHLFDTSSPIFAGTAAAAEGAAACAVAAADAVADRTDGDVAYALCRPPGHHAMADRAGGFCYFNNAALAAERLTARGARVAVLDIDLHHGNGTQDIFADRADVAFVSLHVDPAEEYPYFWGFAEERGTGEAEGTNLNLPLPKGTDIVRFREALSVGLAAVAAHGADALVCSLGVDTHREDPIGSFTLDTADYPGLGAMVAAAGLPTVVVQEGGYHLPSLGSNVVGFLRGLLGG